MIKRQHSGGVSVHVWRLEADGMLVIKCKSTGDGKTIPGPLLFEDLHFQSVLDIGLGPILFNRTMAFPDSS